MDICSVCVERESNSCELFAVHLEWIYAKKQAVVFAPNNGPTVNNCLGVVAKAKGVSIGLDVLGAIPAFGNAVSAGAGIVRAAPRRTEP